MNVNELDKKINFREYGVVEDEFIPKSLAEIQNPVVKKREEAPVVKRVVEKPIFENIAQKEDLSIIDEKLKHDKLVLNYTHHPIQLLIGQSHLEIVKITDYPQLERDFDINPRNGYCIVDWDLIHKTRGKA